MSGGFRNRDIDSFNFKIDFRKLALFSFSPILHIFFIYFPFLRSSYICIREHRAQLYVNSIRWSRSDKKRWREDEKVAKGMENIGEKGQKR